MKKSLVSLAAILASTTAAVAAWGAFAHGSNLTGEATISTPGLDKSGLRGFGFHFTNGDHKIRSLGFMPSGSIVKAVFADGNGDDPYNFNAQGVDVPDLSSSKVASKKACTATCSVPIENVPAGRVVLLQGFKFTRHGGDANVREIAVRPIASQDRFSVTYKDNGTFPYDVEIRYAFAPETRFKKVATAMNEMKGAQDTIVVSSGENGTGILRGFAFSFENGDHHLKVMSVQPSSVSGRFAVKFHDQNYDDHYKAWIDYALLK